MVRGLRPQSLIIDKIDPLPQAPANFLGLLGVIRKRVTKFRYWLRNGRTGDSTGGRSTGERL